MRAVRPAFGAGGGDTEMHVLIICPLEACPVSRGAKRGQGSAKCLFPGFHHASEANHRGFARVRRGGRVVECTALEMRHRCKLIGGSNPSLSARLFRDSTDPSIVGPGNRHSRPAVKSQAWPTTRSRTRPPLKSWLSPGDDLAYHAKSIRLGPRYYFAPILLSPNVSGFFLCVAA